MAKERMYVEVDYLLKTDIERAAAKNYVSVAAWVTFACVERLAGVNKPVAHVTPKAQAWSTLLAITDKNAISSHPVWTSIQKSRRPAFWDAWNATRHGQIYNTEARIADVELTLGYSLQSPALAKQAEQCRRELKELQDRLDQLTSTEE